jgi:hypothetical protein
MKHSHGLAIPTTLEDVCDPQRMALLVYDMQVGICSQIKSGSEIVTRIGRLLAVARAKGDAGGLHQASVVAKGMDGSNAISDGYGLAGERRAR